MRWLLPLLTLAMLAAPAAADDWSLTRPPRSKPQVRSAARAQASSSPRRALRRLLRQPFDAAVRARFAQTLQRDGQELTGQAFEAALSEETDQVLRQIVLGLLLSDFGQQEEARIALARAQAIAPQRSELHRALAELAAQRGDDAAERTHLKAALVHAPRADRSQLSLRLAELDVQAGDLDAARAALPERSRRTLVDLARVAEAAGRIRVADTLYDEALTLPRGNGPAAAALLLTRARFAQSAGDSEEALVLLDRARQAQGLDAGLRNVWWELRYDVLAALGRYEQFLSESGRAGRRTVEQWRRIALAHEALGHGDQAVGALRKATGRGDVGRAEFAALLDRLGRREALLELYARWRQEEPGAWIPWEEPARLLLEMGRRGEAVALLRQAGERSRSPEVLAGAYRLLLSWAEPSAAERILERWHDRAANDPQVLSLLVEHRLRHGMAEGVSDLAERAIAGAERPVEMRRHLATLMLEHGLPLAACRHLERAHEERPEDGELSLALAAALGRCHRERDAAATYTSLLARRGLSEAQRAAARRRLVSLWHDLGELPQQALRLERAIGFDRGGMTFPRGASGDPEDALLLVEVYLRLAQGGGGRNPQFELLADRLLEAISVSVPSVANLTTLERLRATRGDEAGAVAALERLLQVDPEHRADYLERLAERASHSYRDADALRYARALVEARPTDAGAHARLADLRHAQGDDAAARAAYERALAIDPGRDADRLALARLLLIDEKSGAADEHLLSVIAHAEDVQLVREAVELALPLAAQQRAYVALLEAVLSRLERGPDSERLRATFLRVCDAALPSEGVHGGHGARAIALRGASSIAEALLDDDPTQQQVALSLLSRLSWAGATPALLSLAERSGDAGLRREALLALPRGLSEASRMRVAALLGLPEQRVRSAAAWVLAMEAQHGARIDATALLSHHDSQVRCYGALSLSGRPSAHNVKAAAHLLEGDPSILVRSCAAATWSTWKTPPPPPEMVRLPGEQRGVAAHVFARAVRAAPQDQVRLALRLQDQALLQQVVTGRQLREGPWLLPRPPVRMRDLSGLLLVHRTEPHPVGWEQLGAAVIMGLARPEQAALALQLLVQHPQLRPNSGQGRGALVEALDAGQGVGRLFPRAVCRVLAPLTDVAVGRGLLAGLSHPDAAVRVACLEALRGAQLPLPPPLQGQVVHAAHQDSRWAVRRAAVELLGRWGAAFPAALLKSLQHDPQAPVRAAAARALTDVADARPALLSTTNTDPDADVRAAARRALLREPADRRTMR